MTAATSAERWLRAAVAWDLLDPRPAVPAPDPATWTVITRRVANERAAGLALRAIDAGAVEADEPQRTWLAARHEGALVDVLRRDRRLLELLEVLGGHGVRPVVLKGTVAAHVLYEDPAMRLYGDIDLLVEPHELGPTLVALDEVGAVPNRPIADASLVGATTRGVAVALPDGSEVDVHTSIAPAAWSPRAPRRTLAVDDRPLVLASTSVAMLAPAPMALHAALHLLLDDGPRRLVPARDLAAALRAERTRQHDVVALARALGLTDLLARGITRGAASLPAVDHPLRGWAQQHRPSHADRLWWWAADRPGRLPLAVRRVQVAAGLDDPADRRRYVVDGLRRRR